MNLNSKNPGKQKLGLWMSTALVVGNMIGFGIFLLPASLAMYGGVSSKQSAGYKSVQWNATNGTGAPVSAGPYLYMIQTGELRQTKKMVLLK